MKKTLIVKLSQDVSMASPAQIAAFKAFWEATFADLCFGSVDFELVEEKGPDPLSQWLRLIRGQALDPIDHMVAEALSEEAEPGIESVICADRKIIDFPSKDKDEASQGQPEGTDGAE